MKDIYYIDILLIEIEDMLIMNLKERLSYLFTNSNSIKHIIIPIENDKCYYLFSEQII